ncbi:MAG: hypothetical protein RLO17_08980 [Cyclobacteriaceae bacterium]
MYFPMLNLLFLFLLQQPGTEIQGHWIHIPDYQKSCTEEIIFGEKAFRILHECFDENEIHEVATGSYLTDGPLIYFSNLMFTSLVSDYYTQEYSRIEWKVESDTLTLNIIRFEAERRTFIRY